ncbi:PBP1A family penicillin-binding protein [Lactococcus cremoris]|jgi:penicillin-binding protein 2A|uniref:Membrane carboxypeptidase (Penicillin-binding protein) n=4 Tax=Bacteria TaxID=2 RepID=A0A1V0PCQ4_LACLC|nr:MULTISPECIES: PBP1A family penicillin-binding protein [Lactococcus]EQC93272.1 penicillin-binding protein 2A [Lactococcus cremoris subsp. cremoris TIFN3]ABJ73856.1 Membrane carboxypeptidase (penicillin-binding protein) [Lactococcus cremoris subsp. cremoris SK11]AEU41624.1 Multimodular transpeptidase-transglycosylase [Lactococcus cremoris subsp. cremoris A76]AGV74108.1 penicillin-binding protein 2A [Lactococcus cremoris subsp. cremoris KW2]ARE19265.2 PBP1A family penicillin-binding protein [L
MPENKNFSRRSKKETGKKSLKIPKIRPKKQKKLEEEIEKPAKTKFGKFMRPIKRFWKRYNLTKITIIFVLVAIVATGSYLFYLAKTANVKVLQSSISAQTVIYDKDNNEAGNLYGQKGTPVKIDQISKNITNAVVATEDRTFYENHGVNLKRFALAAVTLGRFGGGSTITQQLAKNAYLTQEQTIDRKAREFFLALEINKHYSKDEILDMYLNNSYFGNGVWGIQDAALKYFGVPASEVTVDEAASLAGMLKGPEIYNPLYEKGKYATDRRNTVLQNMVNAGYLEQSQADSFMKVDLQAQLQDNYQSKSSQYKYPSYYNAVISEAERKYGLTLQEIMNNGYKIYTGMDQNMQSGLQKTYADPSFFPQAADGTYAQSASVAIDPKTGAVNALVGNVNTEGSNSFTDYNYATMSKRSPGSVIKPLIVYAPAIEAGWSIDKTVDDSPADYNGWKPTDFDNQWRGQIPMYTALANSYNIPAINTYQAIGPKVGNALGREFGLDLNSKNDVLPTALGAGVETNPWQIAQAYQAFANGGVMNDAHLITKIENAAGQVVKTAKVNKKRVVSKDTADKMTQMMLGTYTNGSAWKASPKSYTLAGKTGTNEDQDQWVVGYTPDVVMALWVGYSDGKYKLTGSSEGQTSVIFRQEASYMLPYTKGTPFTVENPYAQAGVAAQQPYWTQQRQYQDDIVDQEQAEANTTGNTPESSSSSTSSSSDSNGLDLGKIGKNIGDAAKNAWDKVKGVFGN